MPAEQRHKRQSQNCRPQNSFSGVSVSSKASWPLAIHRLGKPADSTYCYFILLSLTPFPSLSPSSKSSSSCNSLFFFSPLAYHLCPTSLQKFSSPPPLLLLLYHHFHFFIVWTATPVSSSILTFFITLPQTFSSITDFTASTSPSLPSLNPL